VDVGQDSYMDTQRKTLEDALKWLMWLFYLAEQKIFIHFDLKVSSTDVTERYIVLFEMNSCFSVYVHVQCAIVFAKLNRFQRPL